jgi:hypothetical protein
LNLYRTTGFDPTTYELFEFSIQTDALDPILDYTADWRDLNGLFSSSFDADVCAAGAYELDLLI